MSGASGSIATIDAPRGVARQPNPARLSRVTALSRALRKFDRSRAENAFGPAVVSPVERK